MTVVRHLVKGKGADMDVMDVEWDAEDGKWEHLPGCPGVPSAYAVRTGKGKKVVEWLLGVICLDW